MDRHGSSAIAVLAWCDELPDDRHVDGIELGDGEAQVVAVISVRTAMGRSTAAAAAEVVDYRLADTDVARGPLLAGSPLRIATPTCGMTRITISTMGSANANSTVAGTAWLDPVREASMIDGAPPDA